MSALDLERMLDVRCLPDRPETPEYKFQIGEVAGRKFIAYNDGTPGSFGPFPIDNQFLDLDKRVIWKSQLTNHPILTHFDEFEELETYLTIYRCVDETLLFRVVCVDEGSKQIIAYANIDLTASQRINHVWVHPWRRRCGIASDLIKYITSTMGGKYMVADTDSPIFKVLIDIGFENVGFLTDKGPEQIMIAP